MVGAPPPPRPGPRAADHRSLPQAAETIGLAGSQITSAVADLWGWRARVALSRGQTVEDAVARLPAIESALGTRRGAVRVLPIPERADRFELRVVERDPHADAITSPGAAISTITEPAELGVFEDGSPVRVPLLRRHVMVGGVTGAGKSGLLNVILDNLAACRDVVIWGIDLRGGTELRPWSSCLDRLATTPEAAEELLRDAVAILDGRAAALAEPASACGNPPPAPQSWSSWSTSSPNWLARLPGKPVRRLDRPPWPSRSRQPDHRYPAAQP